MALISFLSLYTSTTRPEASRIYIEHLEHEETYTHSAHNVEIALYEGLQSC